MVLLELLADERLKDGQFYAFKEYKNANGWVDAAGSPGWTVGELNAILENNLVPGTKGHLSTFGAIQWESELSTAGPRRGGTLLICPSIVS